MEQEILLDVQNLKKYFPIRQGLFGKTIDQIKAVDDVSLHIHKGETLGLVGESGCGKTTTGRSIIRAIEPTAGKIIFSKDGQKIDVGALKSEELRQLWKHIQMIFQDPYSSLNPRMTLKEIIGEPFIVHNVSRGKELEERVATLLKRVGLRSEYMIRYPHAFSGGQRQRIGIARALALNPSLVICDEPVSALDVSVQAQILNLLQKLQDEYSLTYLFIAHDLAVVEHLCDRVAVMYLGQLVESANTEELFGNPRHPYTETLMSAVLHPDPEKKHVRISRQLAHGEIQASSSGCKFAPRCPYAIDICREIRPELRKVGQGGHIAACHLVDKLQLKGI